MRSPNELTEEVNVPSHIAAALATGRSELVGLVKEYTPEQVTSLVNLVRVLIDTNRELRNHAAVVSLKIEHARGCIKGALSGIEAAKAFAEFIEEGV